MSNILKAAILVVLCATLSACTGGNGTITVGSKNFGENNILANMIAILAEDKGLTVNGPVEYPTTQSVLEALKRGDVDIYPGYNGTGLVMVGQNPTADGDDATARVKELYEPLGLTWLPRLGFANNYGLAMRASRAEARGIASISDLVEHAGDLKLGVEDDFQRRPLDGLQPLLARYGMAFDDLSVVPLDERDTLYDSLLDGNVDVAEVYTTDGQIADYDLVVLDDDLSFFPVYQAAPLARTDSLASHEGLREAVSALAGKIDAQTMRSLNSRVEIDGQDAETVARTALAKMGLIDSGAIANEKPLVIAESPSLEGSGLANEALRASRKAFEGRAIEMSPTPSPLASVASGSARMALVEAAAFFDLSGPEPVRDDRFEAVAAIGETHVNLVSQTGLDGIGTLVVGPEGTASNRLGPLIVSGLGLDAEIVEADSASAEDLLNAVEANDAQAVLALAPQGGALVRRLTEGTGMRLRALSAWEQKANLVRYPFLRQVRVPAGTYPGQSEAVDTLGTQIVLAGMAPDTSDLVGDQGPSTAPTGIPPIPGESVKALVAAMPNTTLIDPTLKQAQALAPPEPKLPAAVNPAADISVLNLVIVLLMVWFGWLYIRPERR